MPLLRENHNNALTMGYQAMEHAAKALLAANDVETGSHHAVHVQVSLHLVKSGKAGQEYSSELRRAYRDRAKATYSSSYWTQPTQAESATDRAHDYLTKARARLRSVLLEDLSRGLAAARRRDFRVRRVRVRLEAGAGLAEDEVHDLMSGEPVLITVKRNMPAIRRPVRRMADVLPSTACGAT